MTRSQLACVNYLYGVAITRLAPKDLKPGIHQPIPVPFKRVASRDRLLDCPIDGNEPLVVLSKFKERAFGFEIVLDGLQ